MLSNDKMAKTYMPSSDLFNMLMSRMLSEPVSKNDCNLDVGELAKILQALTFRVCSNGVSEPSIEEELSTDPPSGVRITVTCLKSRQELVLLSDTTECNCSQVDENKGSWEVVATSGSRSSLVESACGGYPPLKPETAMAVRKLMEHVVGLASGKIQPPQACPLTPKWRERRSDGWQRLSLGGAEDRPPTLNDLASRYRSLDTLIAKDDGAACADLPIPGKLLKPGSSTRIFDTDNRSISDSHLATQTSASVSISPAKTTELDHLRIALDSINKAIALHTKLPNKELQTPRPQSVSRSNPTLQSTRMLPPSSSELPRVRINNGTKVRPNAAVSKKPVDSVSVPKKTSTITASKKYAHIKSTIPKITKN